MKPDPYRTSAPRYDRLIEPLNRTLRAIGLSMAPAAPPMAVLDVGCGTGTHLALYVDRGCEGVGIDPSPSMLAQARKKLDGRAELTEGDATAMPYADDRFDLAILSLILHETEPDVREQILREAIRVTRPGGSLLVIDYTPTFDRTLSGAWKKAVILLIERLAGREHYAGYQHFIRTGGVPALAESHGLTVAAEKIVSGGNLGVYRLDCEGG